MDCCNNKKNGSSNSEAVENGFCRIRGKRWVWLPYEDHYLQSAQFLSVLCLFVSWVWWVTFLINLAALLPIQVIWCSRQTRAWMLASVAVAILSGLASIGTGIYVAIVYREHDNCQIFTSSLWSYDDDDPFYDHAYKHADHCNEALWATIAVVCGFLWFVVAGLIAWFVRSGAHAGWEECHASKADGSNKYCSTESRINSRSNKVDHSYSHSNKVDSSHRSKVDSQTNSVESGRVSDELTPPPVEVSAPEASESAADLEAGDEFPDIKDPWTETGSDRKDRSVGGVGAGGGNVSFLL